MVVRIRFARHGRVRQPFYRIVVINARTAQRGKPFEYLGTYNPRAGKDGVKELRLNLERVKYWLGVGAQPSEPIAKLLGRAGVIPAYPRRESPKKAQPKQKREMHTAARPEDVLCSLPACVASLDGPILMAGLRDLPWMRRQA